MNPTEIDAFRNVSTPKVGAHPQFRPEIGPTPEIDAPRFELRNVGRFGRFIGHFGRFCRMARMARVFVQTIEYDNKTASASRLVSRV